MNADEEIRHYLQAEYKDAEISELRSINADLLEACEHAFNFIQNGVAFGYIDWPDPPDPAVDTLPKLRAAIAKAKEA